MRRLSFYFASNILYWGLSSGGGIGIHTRLRAAALRAYGFKSHPGHTREQEDELKVRDSILKSFKNKIDGAYSVAVSTRVCGTLSQGSNPCRHPR